MQLNLRQIIKGYFLRVCGESAIAKDGKTLRAEGPDEITRDFELRRHCLRLIFAPAKKLFGLDDFKRTSPE
jgi:hypothetical protein